MKPFLEGSQLPPDPVPVLPPALTQQAQVAQVMADGSWFTRKQLEQATGLTTDAVNTALQHGIRRGSVERELPLLRGCTKAVTQRYRRRG